MLAFSQYPSDHLGLRGQFRHLVGWHCSCSAKTVDVCSRTLGTGSHVIAFALMILCHKWWNNLDISRVVTPMHLHDIRKPEHLQPPSHLGQVIACIANVSIQRVSHMILFIGLCARKGCRGR